MLDLILVAQFDPVAYGELVQFGQVLPWYSAKRILPCFRRLGRAARIDFSAAGV